MPSRRGFQHAFAAILAGALLAACSAAPPPVYEPLRGALERNPVVLVPGLTGTELLRDDGSRGWGDGRSLLKPRDGGWELGLPPVASGIAPLVPGRVIETIRLGRVVKPVYGPIVELLEANGYRRGELARPRPGDSLFLFAYDWRRELDEAARELGAALERLRVARGVATLEVDLVCQSGGALVCRYLARYGTAALEVAEPARGGPPPGLVIDKVILVGTANGGSLRMLQQLHRGRRYVPAVGRPFRPEVLFTLPSLFQDLPFYRDDLFVDSAGEPLAIDVFEAANWETYGWSIFSAPARRRLAKAPLDAWPGASLAGVEEQRRYLERSLARARRLHELLERDVQGFASRYYSIQNRAAATPERALVERDRKGSWRLRFPGERGLGAKSRLGRLLVGPGDGHAAAASQEWLSPQELAARPCPRIEVDAPHFEMILEDVARRSLLRFLAGECG